jgi:hypothetical protein
MNLKSKTSWLSAAGLGALLLTGPAAPPASAGITIRFGRGDNRLEGQRFRTMRALAHRLDEAAQKAASVAGDTAQERNGRMQQRFLWAINDFARQARSFHERLDQYGNQPWDVADEVEALSQRARQVNSQIRGAHAFPETYDDWAEAVNALNLMTRSLGGQDVAIPPAERRAYQPFDEGYRYSDGRHIQGFGGSGDQAGYVTGTPLREFRRLANSLNVQSDRAVSAAEQSPDRNNRSLADLRHFAQRTSDLNRSSGADALNPREIGPVVGRLMDDARQNDRSMRENSEFPRVEWAASIRLLEQMASIVQYQ